MELIGYARESIIDKDSSMQIAALKAAGCTALFIEQKGESSSHEAIAFNECMRYLRKGDTLLVTRLDRLMCSMVELQKLLIKLREKQVNLKVIEQSIDTDGVSGKVFLDMLCIFSECEKVLRHERQLVGIARAKREGKFKGRKPMLSEEQVLDLKKMTDMGEKKSDIAKYFKMSRETLYRYINSFKNNH